MKTTNVLVNLTKTGKKSVRYADGICKGMKLDKCAMSFFFEAWSYYGIYWYSANYNDMVEAFLALPCINIINQ